ncbi:MAG: hypothetical protein ACKVOR_00645 [Flavobacteriales bacterium]
MKILYISITLIAALGFGFVLEMVKVNINYTLENAAKIPEYYTHSNDERVLLMSEAAIYAPYDYYHNHRVISSLYSLSENQLNKLKWATTLAGTVVFMLFHLLLLKLITGQTQLLKWTVWIYLLLFALSFGVYLFGTATGTLQYAYGVSRKIAGALQSLIPLMFILPGWWLWRATQSKPDL